MEYAKGSQRELGKKVHKTVTRVRKEKWSGPEATALEQPPKDDS